MQKERINLRKQFSKKGGNAGITLIALVITVIVLLILAGTAISIAVNGNNIFAKANTAVNAYNSKAAQQEQKINEVFDVFNGYTVKMTLGEGNAAREVILNKVNFGDYLGEVVTNYKTTQNATEDITVASAGNETYTVSTTYRLFWIDWDNKYGDGAGTIYLKADCTSNNYDLRDSSDAVLEGSADTSTNSKMRNLNPALYKDGVTAPTSTNNNMKAVRWLTDTSVWFDNTHATKLTAGLSSSIAAKVNYVVGAPSLEMFMDSYNAHYGLTNGTMDTGARTSSSERTKLFYRYPAPTGLNNYGYVVGPWNNSTNGGAAVEGYWYRTSDYTVQADTMYYPGSGKYYWLASPSAGGDNSVMYVGSNGEGRVDRSTYNGSTAFCPLVSLQSDVQL